ncbi:MAG: hypothetical protein R3F43_14625 [bacterium]
MRRGGRRCSASASSPASWKRGRGRAATRRPCWPCPPGATAAREDEIAREIAALTDGADLDTLADRLAQVVSGDAGRVTGPQAIGSIFGVREKPAAVVEADSHLVPVELALDDVAPRAERAGSDMTSAPPLPPVAPRRPCRGSTPSRRSCRRRRRPSSMTCPRW